MTDGQKRMNWKSTRDTGTTMSNIEPDFCHILALSACAGLVLTSCVEPLAPCADVAGAVSCPMPGWVDRAFDLRVPPGWDGTSPLPVIYAFHGGGGNRTAAERVTCPDGDVESSGCLSAKATAAGYAVVRPDGTGSRPVRNARTWNAGGGVGDWQCVSGGACKSGADDLRYFDELHAEIGRLVPIDANRVYATGLSNGAAFPNRLACERSEILAAIAPVGGANQHAAAGGACAPGVAVFHIHGTEDPCWTYESSTAACLQTDGKIKVGARASLDAWAERNGCSPLPSEERLPDTSDDGTVTTRLRWLDCAADVEHLRVEGGGHTWPGGDAYSDVAGPVSQDFDADDLILEFFDAHPRVP